MNVAFAFFFFLKQRQNHTESFERRVASFIIYILWGAIVIVCTLPKCFPLNKQLGCYVQVYYSYSETAEKTEIFLKDQI